MGVQGREMVILLQCVIKRQARTPYFPHDSHAQDAFAHKDELNLESSLEAARNESRCLLQTLLYSAKVFYTVRHSCKLASGYLFVIE